MMKSYDRRKIYEFVKELNFDDLSFSSSREEDNSISLLDDQTITDELELRTSVRTIRRGGLS